MNTMLIVLIAALLLVLLGFGYQWLFRTSKTARFRNYVKVSQLAARDYRRDDKWAHRNDRR